MPKFIDVIMDDMSTHGSMSKQALASKEIQRGILEILLGPGQLYEALRAKAEERKS